MYFVTQSEEADKEHFVRLATFFIEKFPLAFGAVAVYHTEKSNSKVKDIRVSHAKEIKYEGDNLNTERAQIFEQFGTQAQKSLGDRQSNSERAKQILLALFDQCKELIMQLESSKKMAECTI